ncbi:MAG: YiiX/YebB-like N1pC/P60 family cysteine hydrolase [Alistipes onderdonkii]
MKQALIYIGMLLLAISCGQNRDRLHTGDLLFQAGKNTEMTGAITAATGEEGPLNFSHVGIAVTGNGADSVLEATTDGGVRLTLLEEFLGRSAKIGGRPAVVAMRLKDTAGIAAAVRRARSFLGVPYDYSFRPGREKLYCSELVWESYRAENGTRFSRRGR